MNLAYKVIGEGPIDLVLVPGFVWHVELFAEYPANLRFMERIASFARVITYDKREQGMSDRLGRPPTLEESMEDLHAVMDAAGSERAVLFGASEGGPMSMLFAATHPDRTRALVLYGTFASLYTQSLIGDESLDSLMQLFDEDWGGPVGAHLWAPSVAEDPEFTEWWAKFLRQGTSLRGAKNLLTLYREIDVRPILGSIDVPTLVLHREFDMVAPLPLGQQLADRIPGARLVMLEGSDHIWTIGDQDSILDEVEEFVTGQRPGREPERVLSTVLFTDIVGSTERAATMGDAGWRELLGRHDTLVRKHVDRHRGRAIKSLGDGYLATFDGPARGVRCAQDICAEVERLGIEVRAGLHTGECELIGDDVGGMAVHIGARVSAKAGPGEVLVSSTVKDLVVGSGLEFEERGETALKGVPGEWRLFAAR